MPTHGPVRLSGYSGVPCQVNLGVVLWEECLVIVPGAGMRDFLEDVPQVVVGFEAAGFGGYDETVCAGTGVKTRECALKTFLQPVFEET